MSTYVEFLNQQKSEEDFSYEEDVLRNPYQLKVWWRYIDAKSHESPEFLNLLYERALKEIPGSYKLWFHYLDLRAKQVDSKSISDISWEDVNQCFERCLKYMYKMPRIWEEYLKFLMKQHFVTRTRKTFDRALQTLPITQHSKIWKLYKLFTKQEYVPTETVKSIWKRYLLLEPQNVEEYIQIMLKRSEFDEACLKLTQIVNDDHFKSIYNKSKNDLWVELCEIISKNAEFIKSIDPSILIKKTLKKFQTDVGQFWCFLATYYINLGEPEKACDTFEEAIRDVSSVRDFSLIFDAWSKFLYEVVSIKMKNIEEEEEDSEFTLKDDLDLWTQRLEYLLDKREEYLNDVKLRQNPHNIHEWYKRTKIFENNPNEVQEIYKKAVSVIDPKKSIGKLHLFWINYAKSQKDIDDLRNIFSIAIQQRFKTLDELASVWCEWIEIELKEGNYEFCRELLAKATEIPENKKWKREDIYKDILVQEKLYKSFKLWSLYADIEESYGTIESTREVYEKMIDLKVATPQTIINYCNFLEENKYFELSFKAYERGIHLFGYPQVYHIWVHYLVKFIKRYKDKKIERTRDLFEQSLIKIPSEFAMDIFLLYAKFEEDYGLIKNAMTIYDRSLSYLNPEKQYEMFNIYISRASEYFGVTKTRDIYEKAIQILPTSYVKEICLKFADMERKLGEIDRARAIYIYTSNYCNPDLEPKFWEIWYEFEKFHGNQETGKEMLRIKKSVSNSFNLKNVNVKSMIKEPEENKEQPLKRKRIGGVDVMSKLEENSEEISLEEEPEKKKFTQEEVEIKEIPKSLFTKNIK